MKKKGSAGLDLKPIAIGVLIILVPLIAYVFYRLFTSDNRLIPVSVLAVILGAIIESWRLSRAWKPVLWITMFAFALSFFAFTPGKHEIGYVFEDHIATWPYMFLLIFVILTYAFNREKVIPWMTEGITLILSVGIIYWVIDHGFLSTSSPFLWIVMSAGFVIAFFSILNAFLKITLTKSIRLFLSIWSSVILILLAVDNIDLVYQNGQVEDSIFLIDKINVGLQYFLLGTCSVYILQNAMMIWGYLPERGRLFNKQYFQDVRELTNEHINRYSENQSGLAFSSCCLVLSSGFFLANYLFDLLPRNTAIWLVFFLLNNLVYLYEGWKPCESTRPPFSHHNSHIAHNRKHNRRL